MSNNMPILRFIKNMKVALLYELLDKVHACDIVNKQTPCIFSTKEMSDKLNAYVPSISREIRALKAQHLLDYEVTDKLKGEYKLKIAGNKWNKGAFEASLLASIKQLNTRVMKSPGNEIKQMLNEARNRRLSGLPPKPQTSK